MRIVVLGANGLLGSAIVAGAVGRDWSVVGTFHTEAPDLDVEFRQLDIRQDDRFADLVDRVDPDAVVNCAAITDVDQCETELELANEVNGEAPGRLARVCANHGVEFCHLSTDYVFDGQTDERYTEAADPDPIQAYGESKLAGEQAVMAASGEPLVPRVSFLYGVHAASGALHGFPKWVRNRLRRDAVTPLFDDQSITPTRSGQAASVILDLLELNADGLYHVASRSCVTPREFGEAVCHRMAADRSLLQATSMDSVDRPARRPRYTCLDVARLEDELGDRQPTLAEDLDAIDEVLSSI